MAKCASAHVIAAHLTTETASCLPSGRGIEERAPTLMHLENDSPGNPRFSGKLSGPTQKFIESIQELQATAFVFVEATEVISWPMTWSTERRSGSGSSGDSSGTS